MTEKDIQFDFLTSLEIGIAPKCTAFWQKGEVRKRLKAFCKMKSAKWVHETSTGRTRFLKSWDGSKKCRRTNRRWL
jgi:hypothetical protein